VSLRGRYQSFQTVVIKRYFHCSRVPNRIATYSKKRYVTLRYKPGSARFHVRVYAGAHVFEKNACSPFPCTFFPREHRRQDVVSSTLRNGAAAVDAFPSLNLTSLHFSYVSLMNRDVRYRESARVRNMTIKGENGNGYISRRMARPFQSTLNRPIIQQITSDGCRFPELLLRTMYRVYFSRN